MKNNRTIGEGLVGTKQNTDQCFQLIESQSNLSTHGSENIFEIYDVNILMFWSHFIVFVFISLSLPTLVHFAVETMDTVVFKSAVLD